MFIDIHTHILPFLDDGSKDLVMTENMLLQAKDENISEIIATPHFLYRSNKYDKNKLLETFIKVNNLINDLGVDIKLHLGNELFFDIDSKKVIDNNECLTLAKSKYVLIEFSHRWRKDIVQNLIYNIELLGYKIILAHIERYENFYDEKVLADFINKGCLAQINSDSIFTKNKAREKYLLKLIENNYIHFVASDCHSDGRRSPKLRKSYDKIKSIIGVKADDLFINNPKKVINNTNIDIDEPKEIKRKSVWGGIANWINKR